MLGTMLENVRKIYPLVHCVSNAVTANDCANILLASGASAVMAEDEEEVEEITSGCAGLVLNMGMFSRAKERAMHKVGKCANQLGHPIVLDPVGVGASSMRWEAARRLLKEIRFSIIRGNASEISTLAGWNTKSCGVDSWETDSRKWIKAAQKLACETGSVVVLSGREDVVTDGTTVYRVYNGHEMMRQVTGTGCMLSALLGAYAAANQENQLMAALAAVCAMGLCGEKAHERLAEHEGNATYRNYIIDAVFRLRGDELEEGARYERIE